jgi:hypothetical protein
MRWAGHVAARKEKGNACKISVRMSVGKISLGIAYHKWILEK